MTSKTKNPSIILFVRKYLFAKQYFGNILQKLEQDFSIVIFHISELEQSKGNDSYYENYDLSTLSNTQIRSLLKKLNPAFTLITNVRSLLDIYYISVCNNLKINIIYIEHGLTLSKINLFKKSNLIHSLTKYYNYGLKSLSFIFTSSSLPFYFNSIYNALKKSDYSQIKINGALLYSEESIKPLKKLKINFDICQVAFAGYPIAESEKEISALLSTKPKKQILFIHQPLINDNFLDLTIQDEIKILKELKAISEEFGYNFILKLHPRSEVELYKKELKDNIIYNERTTEELIADSEIIIGYFSTALITAIKLKRALLIFNQEELKTDEINTFIGEGNSFTSIAEFRDILTIFGDNPTKYHSSSNEKYLGMYNSHENRYRTLMTLINKL